MESHIEFYLNSLIVAESNIIRGNKALKDVVGIEFEQHRKRIWEYFGFVVKKNKNYPFSPDWCIYDKNGILLIVEEDKGHYLDSCFMERGLCGIAKTVLYFKKNNLEIPIFLIHSFTKYKLFDIKFNEDIESRREDIADIMKHNVKYTYLTDTDRISSKKWFKYCNGCYSNNINISLVINDIKFILSLIK